MRRNPLRRAALGAALAVAIAPLGAAAETRVTYSRAATDPVVSFRQIWPEFAEQDPTPLVRIFGDGRVVVHRPVYMKNSGVYDMWLAEPELDALLDELTPALLEFEEPQVRTRRNEAEAALRAAARASGEPTLFHVADAEISVFELAVHTYRPVGGTRALVVPPFERRWQGLTYDAERYPGVQEIQSLKRAEDSLRALTERRELTWVAPVPTP